MNILDTQFSSEFRYEHIPDGLKGSVILPVVNGGGDTSFAITHNFGYVPFARAYVNWPTDSHIFNLTANFAVVYPQGFLVTDYHLTSTQLLITLESSLVWGSGGNYTVYYRIYAEPQAA